MTSQQICYDHSQNSHGVVGPGEALPHLIRGRDIRSLLDVGCGTGTWLRAALNTGIARVKGIDGVVVADSDFCAPKILFEQVNLEEPFDLRETFDVALCLEVAEHLPPSAAPDLVRSLCLHSDVIIFSAACPGQPGQHHVNCQWPEYWQSMFNQNGFVCSDDLRWRIWDLTQVEVWYRQNIITAVRSNSEAGSEPRIPKVIHPEFASAIAAIRDATSERASESLIQNGFKPTSWYIKQLLSAVRQKATRGMRRFASKKAPISL